VWTRSTFRERRCSTALVGWSSVGEQCVAGCSSLAPLEGGEPDEERVEEGQEGESDCEAVGESVDLVGDERAEQGDGPGVGPELLAEECDDEYDFGDAVAEQVDGREQGRAVGELRGGVQQVAGDEVVGVLGEFVGGQAARPGLQGGGCDEQQCYAADDLQ
jgi:hypothetical protein